jgi:predicted nuclease with TOPRIM domain
MEQITLRISENTLESLEGEADEHGRSRSEHIRDVLEKRHEVEELRSEHAETVTELREEIADLERQLDNRNDVVDSLRERLENREQRIDDLEEQLARRSQIEEKVDVLAKRVEDSQLTYAERRQRMIDEASLAQRLRWKVTGVPVDRDDVDE